MQWILTILVGKIRYIAKERSCVKEDANSEHNLEFLTSANQV